MLLPVGGISANGTAVECAYLYSRDSPNPPRLPPGLLTDNVVMERIVCAPEHVDGMCALLSNGTAMCWGSFVNLEYDGLTQPWPVFVMTTPPQMYIAQLDIARTDRTGRLFSTFRVHLVATNGTIFEWRYSLLRPGGAGENPTSVAADFNRDVFCDDCVSDAMSPLQQVSPHADFICALTQTGAVFCRFDALYPTQPPSAGPLSGGSFSKITTVTSKKDASGACVCGMR